MSTFSGSLHSKRKGELVEIAEALGLSDLDVKREEVLRSIHAFLEANEAELSTSPRFKGLYNRRSKHVDSPESDSVGEVKTPAERVRKAVNKTIDRLTNDLDPANVALPESPISVSKASRKVEAATESLTVALTPAKDISQDLQLYVNDASSAVVKFAHDSRQRVNVGVEKVRDHLSRPEHLVSASLVLELGAVLSNLAQFYDHTIFFPPAPGGEGSISTLLSSLLFWAPSFSLNVRLPELASFRPGSDLWPALAWWLTATVLPALALSTIVNSQIKPKTHTHNTRSQSHAHTTVSPDPLSFAIIRLALVLYPLTTAASSTVVDALEASGNLQLRALGASVLAALVLAFRLS